MSDRADTKRAGRRRLLLRRWLVALALLAVLGGVFTHLRGQDKKAPVRSTTYVVRRGTLPITIVEGGSAESLAPHKVVCEVKGNDTKILFIVEEGYRITRKDIEDRLLLVQLNASEIENRITSQEISYQNAKAAFSKAQQDYEVQEKQNESDIDAAKRAVKFKAMDLQKYLGEDLADELIEELRLRRAAEDAAQAAQNAATAARGAAQDAEDGERARVAESMEELRKEEEGAEEERGPKG
ncbi:MAG TPA: hypothetical protein ENN80_08505, partial [Candidatus Hydrogenedentes bacterium]|nr:hypothetical protein [Candidatus Hydrogenedentota bacterium]